MSELTSSSLKWKHFFSSHAGTNVLLAIMHTASHVHLRFVIFRSFVKIHCCYHLSSNYHHHNQNVIHHTVSVITVLTHTDTHTHQHAQQTPKMLCACRETVPHKHPHAQFIATHRVCVIFFVFTFPCLNVHLHVVL